jgi:hypothetical protein
MRSWLARIWDHVAAWWMNRAERKPHRRNTLEIAEPTGVFHTTRWRLWVRPSSDAEAVCVGVWEGDQSDALNAARFATHAIKSINGPIGGESWVEPCVAELPPIFDDDDPTPPLGTRIVDV